MERFVSGATFDSELRNAWGHGPMSLTLGVRLFLEPFVPTLEPGRSSQIVADVRGNMRRIVPWPSRAVFRSWAREFVDVVESYWNGQLTIVAEGAARHRLRPIHCAFRLLPVSAPERAQMRLRIRRLHEDEPTFTSSMSLGGVSDSSAEDGALDHRDTEVRADGYNTAAHEVGHYLGLVHVDGHRYGLNEDLSYGKHGSRRRATLMGAGAEVLPQFGIVWLERLREHRIDRPPLAVYPRGTRLQCVRQELS